MDLLKTVGIKHLKNNLSAYLRDVRRGCRILISDRDQIVAELREPLTSNLPQDAHPLMAAWTREAKIRNPTTAKKPCPQSPVRYPSGTSAALLDEDRGS